MFKLEALFMLTSLVPVLLLQHIFSLFDQNNKLMKSRLDRKDRSIQIDKVLYTRRGEWLPVFNHLEC